MRRAWFFICVVVVIAAFSLAFHNIPAAAQQMFLPPAFQPGAKLTLNNDPAATYIVLAHQGAWIQVQRESDGASAKETWIYAPNGTTWTKAK